ncbi:asparagine synthetase B family protein [Streptomyces radicis]|uniref:asparagine synthase (glutamine-hydrolyzing) n=1 Tax=Streptomyces radicis TaxID=1750517 RepID=A0A3A9VXQ0_9ACTN|nr:asparagine synthase C-terminal domain-containing protein [Streptomyces radicis]RKN05721.1 asparagine synthase [Streptomyces radicis]RKN17561.1 asparagine synthase [Streptomyces radicis]
MPRCCACAGEAPPDRLRDHLVAMGATVPPDGSALALLDGEPGHATGPFTAEGRAAVGEVTLHNAAELRAALAAAGAPAPPGCADGELLLRCWARLGAAGLRAANGMFALLVVEGGDLVVIRDHAGARTAFYARADGCWAAATSLRALRRWPALATGLNLAAVRSFLTFAYLPGDETLLTGVHEALPGRVLRLAADGSTTDESYWEPEERLTPPSGRAADDPEPHVLGLRALLDEAVACRLPEAEPVGVLLSGGIDSSLVTAIAAKRHAHPVHTYSISFGAELPNELGYSGLVAAHCHTRHRVLTVPGRTVAERLAETVALLDAPVGDPLTVPNLMLAEAAADEGLRVVLNGEGGDPVFGGPKNLPMLVFEMHRAADPADPAIVPDPVGPLGDGDARAEAYLRSYRKCYTDLPRLLTPEAAEALAEAPHPRRLVAPYLRPGRMNALLNQLLHCNLRTKGAHHILTKVERLTASRQLQGRAPLFDHRVIDHAFATPPRLKLSGAVEKWVLKEAVRDLLPDTVVDRPKSGMRVPVQRWLEGPLRDLSAELLLGREARARGLFRAATVREWTRRRGTLLPRHGSKVWLLLTLELWLRAHDLPPT